MRLLVIDAGDLAAHHAAATLRAIGHDVTTCCTLAALVECLMRDPSRVDLILIDRARDAELSADAARYAHWYAPAAQLIAIGGAPELALALALPFPIQIQTLLDLPA